MFPLTDNWKWSADCILFPSHCAVSHVIHKTSMLVAGPRQCNCHANKLLVKSVLPILFKADKKPVSVSTVVLLYFFLRVHVEWQQMRKLNREKIDSSHNALPFSLCRLIQAVYLFLDINATWLLRLLLGMSAMFSCACHGFILVLVPQGLMEDSVIALLGTLKTSQSKVCLIWKDKGLKGAQQSHQNTNIISPNVQLLWPNVAFRAGLYVEFSGVLVILNDLSDNKQSI